MERTAAQPAHYHIEAPYLPQTQYEPQMQYRAVVDRQGQHIVPEDRPGTWAQFSEQNAAALEVLRTDAPMHRRTDAELAVGYLSTGLSRDRTRPLADHLQAPRHQPTDQGGYPAFEPAPEMGHPQQHQQVYYTPDAPDTQPPVHHPGPPQTHGERAPQHGVHAEQAPEQGPEPSGWGQAGVFPFNGGWDVVAAQQGQQARPRQQRWRRRRPSTHKGEPGTVIPNIPTIAPPDQRDFASPDVLVCACMCMKGTTVELADPSNTRLASFSTVSSRYGHEPGADDRIDPRTDDPTAQWPAGRKDMPALQSCMRGTGAAGTYSVGPLATAYPATGYSAGYTDVGASVARGDAQFAGQRQAAQESQTGTSYMAPTRPSTVRTDDPTAHRPPQTAQAQTAHVQTDRQRTEQAAGRKDMHALQSYMRVTGAAGAYSAGPLATAYPATGYTAGYTGVGASVARGDAQFAGERQAAQDSQTGTLYMASTRPSPARTDDLTAHRAPQTAQAQTAQVQTDRQRTGQAAGRKDMHALQSYMRVTGAAGAYSAGPLATAYPATGYTAGYTGVGASVARGDAQFAGQRQAAQESQTGTLYMASTRPSTARTDDLTAHRPPQTAQTQTAQVQTDGNGLDRPPSLRLRQ